MQSPTYPPFRPYAPPVESTRSALIALASFLAVAVAMVVV